MSEVVPIKLDLSDCDFDEEAAEEVVEESKSRQLLTLPMLLSIGGGAITRGLPDIGRQNAAFAKDFLERECIECVTSSLGGVSARRVKFWPVTGRALMLELPPTDTVEIDEPIAAPEPPAGNDVELF